MRKGWKPGALVCSVVASGLAGCGGPATGSQGIARGPSSSAVVSRYAAPPDTVIQLAWVTLRNDGVLARSFQREPSDTTNVAYMESDWIYVPRVFPTAVFGSLREAERWVKILFWAKPNRGGTALFMEVLFNPSDHPSEPVMWSRLRPVPSAHPAWGYVETVVAGIERRLGG
ncbi:MAG: hypothetical protein ACE5JR_03605 [Gemmatimonadota bacterium]